MAKHVEVDPVITAAAFGATKCGRVEFPGSSKIGYGECDVERWSVHFDLLFWFCLDAANGHFHDLNERANDLR